MASVAMSLGRALTIRHIVQGTNIRAIKTEASVARHATLRGTRRRRQNIRGTRSTRGPPSPTVERRSSARSPRNPPPAAPTTGHARNQVGSTAAAAVAPRVNTYVGRRSQGRWAKGARPSVGAARHATEGRSPIPCAGHHPRDARAAVVPLAARVRGAPARHRAGVGRPLPNNPLLDPAGPRPLHRRG